MQITTKSVSDLRKLSAVFKLTYLQLEIFVRITLKTCKRCHREFDEDEELDYSPAGDLSEIFISNIKDTKVEDLCPECREELGIMNR